MGNCLAKSGGQKDNKNSTADMGNNKSKPASASTTPQPQQQSAAATSPPANTGSDPQASQVEEQENRQQSGSAAEGPSATQDKAQRALQAVKERPQSSTDPDAGEKDYILQYRAPFEKGTATFNEV